MSPTDSRRQRRGASIEEDEIIPRENAWNTQKRTKPRNKSHQQEPDKSGQKPQAITSLQMRPIHVSTCLHPPQLHYVIDDILSRQLHFPPQRATKATRAAQANTAKVGRRNDDKKMIRKSESIVMPTSDGAGRRPSAPEQKRHGSTKRPTASSCP